MSKKQETCVCILGKSEDIGLSLPFSNSKQNIFYQFIDQTIYKKHANINMAIRKTEGWTRDKQK